MWPQHVQAVPSTAHIPLLTATLRASQPALRHAAAATLRHLAGAQAIVKAANLPDSALARPDFALDSYRTQAQGDGP